MEDVYVGLTATKLGIKMYDIPDIHRRGPPQNKTLLRAPLIASLENNKRWMRAVKLRDQRVSASITTRFLDLANRNISEKLGKWSAHGHTVYLDTELVPEERHQLALAADVPYVF
ncbi:unnamed protein product [Dibothriocephalus latus]|uniref:Uncharacterized protein n=1 Tax=Dibothriocephalus latus TaxID=60516 RepID=A0A3P7LFP9_DIBLA|nr:unnamed protein product [Dibothriocephalus latus]